ncbi:MAG TPA: hypothetical protein P5238_11140 [Smithellaceae bacterium]|nr:hypothetical protein [Smithellaceae bacterium]HRS84027.1 hypothetical protein [Smithellaceae bacterium]HRV45595.1 hypothetical protein [Smithellaceae bacterium]
MKTGTQENISQTARLLHSQTQTNSGRWMMYFVLLSWLLIFPATVTAQGFYWGSPVSPGYDRSSVVVISGVAIHVDLTPRNGPATLRFESEGETLTVTLGPEWYLRTLKVDLQVGDKLTVKGSKMKTKDGKIYLTAANIKNLRTEQIIELRDESGRPLWSSKRRSNREGRP